MFVRVISGRRLRLLGLTAALITAAAALLLLPRAAAAGVSRGLSLCAAVLIPSLFPFLILSGFFVRSGLCAALARPLRPVTMFLFGLPGCCAPAILLAFVGGYPTGAAAVGELYEQGLINEAQAKRMLHFCVCAGPAFLIGAVGTDMLGSPRYGLLLYAAQVAAALLIGIGERLLRGPLPGPDAAPPAAPAASGEALGESVRAACRALLYLCGFAVAFCALLSLLDVTGLPYRLEQWLSLPFSSVGEVPLRGLVGGLLEISTGCLTVTASGAPDALLLGLLLGFGGASVHCQIAATLPGRRWLDGSFLAARLLHGLLGGLLAKGLLRLIPAPLHVLAAADGTPVRLFAVSASVSAALLLMCGLFLLGSEKIRKNSCFFSSDPL